jgi:hypothetical protein
MSHPRKRNVSKQKEENVNTSLSPSLSSSPSNTKNKKEKENEKDIISSSDLSGSDEEVKPKAPEPPKESTLKKILVRTLLGFCMVGYYLSMLRGGHMYCILTGVLTQVCLLFLKKLI